MGRRVFEEDGQLRPPADLCDRRHGVVAGTPRPRTFTAIASNATPQQIAAGEKLFNTYCVRCHGGATILPDLRRSSPAVLAGLEKILDGALVERGMPRFGELDRPAVAELRAYLLEERRKLAAAK